MTLSSRGRQASLRSAADNSMADIWLDPIPSKGPDHWRQVHIAGDRNPPFYRHQPERPFWKPAWDERPGGRAND